MLLMGFSTSLAKHSVMMRVRATGLSSFRVLMLLCLGTSTTVADLRQAGTSACVRNRLKMSVMLVLVVSKLGKKKIELLCRGCTVVSG